MSNFVSIAIDGPAGAGKSTMARACAQALGYLYVDTGAIYRTVGYYMRLMGVGPKDKDGIARLIDEVNIDIRYEDGVQHMILNGADVTGEIRTPEMSMYASGVSAQPCVRAFLLDMQRQLARTHSVVMDGRDIGTVVLPKADVKIFLTASAEVRAKRRFDELQQKGEKTPYAQILAETKQRDKQDSERAIAPLKQAADAVLLDTSGDTVEQSVNAILDIVRRKLPAGSCIFCANHSGMADPIWILLALPEKKMIRIMAKQELRRVPFIGWVMEKFRVIFVNRGAHDIAAFSQCVDALAREQEKLLVFVEGTRCNREKHVRAKTGAVRMAAQAGVPVVPVFVTRNKTPFCPVSVVFGTPYRVGALDPNDHDACQQASDRLLKTIYELGGDSYADQIG